MTHVTRFDLAGQVLTRDEERAIAERIQAGALVIYPTDTLYAFGCLARHGEAIRLLREAKGRGESKPLPVIAADLDQARSLSLSWPPEAQRLADAFWPGPLTLVVPAASGLPQELLGGEPGIAIRVPDSEGARRLAGLAGPLVSTSANLAGDEPCRTVEMALRAFPQADLAFDLGPLAGTPSTIVEVMGGQGPARILREGRVPKERVEGVLGTAV